MAIMLLRFEIFYTVGGANIGHRVQKVLGKDEVSTTLCRKVEVEKTDFEYVRRQWLAGGLTTCSESVVNEVQYQSLIEGPIHGVEEAGRKVFIHFILISCCRAIVV